MHQSFIDEYIPKISSVEDIYNFFKQLGYTTLTTNYKTNLSSFGLRAKDKEYVEDIYVVSNYDKRFQIYFIKLKSISNEIVHSLSDLFLKTTHFPFLVFSHDFIQQLLNRMMFIYFVAKKRWLGNDLKFMSSFWDMYCIGKKKGDYKQDTFYNDWISVLFFEAFNNKFFPRKYFSND